MTNSKRLAASGVAMVTCLAATSVSGAPMGGELERRFTVAGEAGLFLPGPNGGQLESKSTPGFAVVGVGMGWWLRPQWGLQLTAFRDMGGSRAVASASGAGVDIVDIKLGTLAELLARKRWGHGRARLIAGAGPAIAFGGNYGTVPLANAQFGGELHSSFGLYGALIFQGSVPLQTSSPEVDPARCLTSDCPGQFRAGHPVLGTGLTVGYAF